MNNEEHEEYEHLLEDEYMSLKINHYKVTTAKKSKNFELKPIPAPRIRKTRSPQLKHMSKIKFDLDAKSDERCEQHLDIKNP